MNYETLLSLLIQFLLFSRILVRILLINVQYTLRRLRGCRLCWRRWVTSEGSLRHDMVLKAETTFRRHDAGPIGNWYRRHT